MDTAQTYTQGHQANQVNQANGGSLANVPLPNLSGQANGVVGESAPESDTARPSPPRGGTIFGQEMKPKQRGRDVANAVTQVTSSRDPSTPTAS